MKELEVILRNHQFTVSALTLIMTTVASMVALWVAVSARRLQEVRLRVTSGIRQIIGVSAGGPRSTDIRKSDARAVVTIVNVGHVDTQVGFESFEISAFLCHRYKVLLPLEESRGAFPVKLQRGHKVDIVVFDDETIKDFAEKSRLRLFRRKRLNFLQLYLRTPVGNRHRIYIEPELRERIISITNIALHLEG